MSVLEGSIIKGKVTGITNFGAFVAIDGENIQGLVHISEVSNTFVKDVNEVLTVGQEVEAKVIKVDTDKNKISLSIKATLPEPEKKERKERPARDGEAPRPRRNNGRREEKATQNYTEEKEGNFNSLADKLNAALKK